MIWRTARQNGAGQHTEFRSVRKRAWQSQQHAHRRRQCRSMAPASTDAHSDRQRPAPTSREASSNTAMCHQGACTSMPAHHRPCQEQALVHGLDFVFAIVFVCLAHIGRTHLYKQCVVPGKVPSIGHADTHYAALPNIRQTLLRSSSSSMQPESQEWVKVELLPPHTCKPRSVGAARSAPRARCCALE